MVAAMLRLPVVAVVVLAVLLGTGCTIPSSRPPGPGEPSVPASATSVPAVSPGSVESESAQRAGVDLTALPAPLASGRTPARVSDDANATLEVVLYSLRRTGKTVTGTFSFRVITTNPSTGGGTLMGYLGTMWNPYLVDTTNLKRHGVVSSASTPAMTASGASGQRFRPGQTLYAYATFAAPPADVTTMDVQLLDGIPTAVGVPLT